MSLDEEYLQNTNRLIDGFKSIIKCGNYTTLEVINALFCGVVASSKNCGASADEFKHLVNFLTDKAVERWDER